MASINDPPEIDGPPIKTNKDLPNKSEPWENVELPIDILLLTVKDCEFLSCLSILNSFFRSYHEKPGYVYFGKVGDERMFLKIAVIKCDKGAGGPRGATVVVKDAVEVLRPKAVFCVGFCGGLDREQVKLGDVVVSAKLITYAPIKVLEGGIQERGVRVPPTQRIAKLITGVAHGWQAPLKHPAELEVTVHCDGVFLSGPELVDNKERREELVDRFSEAIAIEMEGEGLFAAAHNLEVPWIIIKGVSDFADGKKKRTNSWRPFASAMAASVVANVLNDSVVFSKWPHYKNEHAESSSGTKRKADSKAATASAEYSESDPKRSKLTVAPAVAVKSGKPTYKELESLSHLLGDHWKPLVRKLFPEDEANAKIHKFDTEHRRLEEKSYQMLLHWKEKNGSDATYEVLYQALSEIQKKEWAEKFCL